MNSELRAHEAAAAAAATEEKERREDEEALGRGEEPKIRDKSTAAQHEARHENYVWGLYGTHVAQKVGKPTKTSSGARCRLQAISEMNWIYNTEANKVVLSDLKREFKSYLEANNLCRGEIPEGLKIHVGSRIKMFAAKTHTSLGFAYAHQSINGRGRCAIDPNHKSRFSV